MKISLTRLADALEHFAGSDPKEIFGLEKDPALRAAGPLHYDVSAQSVEDQLVVKGRVWAEMSVCCGRCAKWESWPVAVDDFLVALEVDEEDDVVDLTPQMREAIILVLPDYPLCRESCKGLCPQCGADLNESTCDCQPPADDRWSGLDGLDL